MVNVDSLKIAGGGQISSGTFGSGHGGNVMIHAQAVVTLVGTDQDGHRSGLLTNTFSSGDAGAIEINAPLLELTNRGAIQSSSAGAGNGGTVAINVNRLRLLSGGQIAVGTVQTGSGDGGNLMLIARESVEIVGTDAQGTPSTMIANSEGSGNAGCILMSTPVLILRDEGVIGAQSDFTTGGNLLINADHLKLINNGEISTSVFGDPHTQGGNVILNSTNIVALNGSAVTAWAGRCRHNTQGSLPAK